MSAEKVIRKPKYRKTGISGFYNDYKRIYEELVQWNRFNNNDTSELKGIVRGIGYAVDDLVYHGYQGERLKNEKELALEIENQYKKLLFVLEDGLGIESEVCAEQVDGFGYYKG